MSKASERALSELHGALAREMEKALKTGVEVLDKNSGEVVRVRPPASYLNVIRQFLKDNNVDTTAENLAGLQQAASTADLPFTDADEFGLPN